MSLYINLLNFNTITKPVILMTVKDCEIKTLMDI